MGADRIGPAVHAQGSLTATRSSLSRAVVHSDARPDHQADATIVKDRKTRNLVRQLQSLGHQLAPRDCRSVGGLAGECCCVAGSFW